MDGITISFQLTPTLVALALVYDAVLVGVAFLAVRRLRRGSEVDA